MTYKNIDFNFANKIMNSDTDYVIIDVREEFEYITGHPKGAILLPVDSIDENTASEVINNKNTIVMLYCRSGRRSAIAATKLCSMGYTNVYNLGSLVDWPFGLYYD